MSPARSPPQTGVQLTRAILDIIMPAIGIQEYVLQLSRFGQYASETAQSYALHFHKLVTDSSLLSPSPNHALNVEREPLYPTMVAFSPCLRGNGLKSNILSLQFVEKPVATPTKAIERARCIEAASAVGDTGSSLSFSRVPNSSVVNLNQP